MDSRARHAPFRIATLAATLAVSVFLTGCDDSSSGTIVYQFRHFQDVSGIEDFRAATSRPEIIAMAREELRKPMEERRLHIAGSIAEGDGDVNMRWNWHFIPDSWTLAEFSIEVCDVSPTLISQNVDGWIGAPGGVCPWTWVLLAEVGPIESL